MQPPRATDDPYGTDAALLPTSLDEALRDLAADGVLRQSFGSAFIDCFMHIKQAGRSPLPRRRRPGRVPAARVLRQAVAMVAIRFMRPAADGSSAVTVVQVRPGKPVMQVAAAERLANSRLNRQRAVTADCDGLTVQLPDRQY